MLLFMPPPHLQTAVSTQGLGKNPFRDALVRFGEGNRVHACVYPICKSFMKPNFSIYFFTTQGPWKINSQTEGGKRAQQKFSLTIQSVG